MLKINSYYSIDKGSIENRHVRPAYGYYLGCGGSLHGTRRGSDAGHQTISAPEMLKTKRSNRGGLGRQEHHLAKRETSLNIALGSCWRGRPQTAARGGYNAPTPPSARKSI